MWIFWSWQFWPIYLLLIAAALIPARLSKTRIAVLAALFVVCLAAWVILPIPSIPTPEGPYGVGTITFRWVDASRLETATDAPDDKRNVIVQAFYPIAKGTNGSHSIYMDGLHNLPPYISILPRFVFKNFARVDTHSIPDAPISANRDRWPVIVFSPGYGAPRSFYTALVTGLASSGRVVLAMDHPYEAGVVELADRQVVGNVIRSSPDDPDRIGYMTTQQGIRAADIRFALDHISSTPFATHLDMKEVSAIGHSFGGASSMAAMDQDSRINAAVNIDGTPYGLLPNKHLRRVMLLESDPVESQHGERYRTGNQKILQNLTGANGYQYAFRQTNHYSFSDFPLFLSPPGRWALSFFFGGSKDPRQAYRAVLDLLITFLSKPAELERVAASYDWISGGWVH